jgi:hypothetical protein
VRGHIAYNAAIPSAMLPGSSGGTPPRCGGTVVQAAGCRGDGFEEGHGSAVGLGWGLWVGSPWDHGHEPPGSCARADDFRRVSARRLLRACGRY